jgi:hypothetical protein
MARAEDRDKAPGTADAGPTVRDLGQWNENQWADDYKPETDYTDLPAGWQPG